MTKKKPRRKPPMSVDEWVKRVVEKAPPLTEEQKVRLAELLKPARDALVKKCKEELSKPSSPPKQKESNPDDPGDKSREEGPPKTQMEKNLELIERLSRKKRGLE